MRSTIRLVDDEKEFRDSSQRLLTRKGYDVVTAENGERALDFLSKNPVDVILLDLKMPVMGGEEFLQAKGPLYPDIPVVVITGHGKLGVVARFDGGDGLVRLLDHVLAKRAVSLSAVPGTAPRTA